MYDKTKLFLDWVRTIALVFIAGLLVYGAYYVLFVRNV